MLKTRARMADALRAFFRERDFLEVETPVLQVSPGMEPHIKIFSTELIEPQGAGRTLHLHTSPEFTMKKLLVAGVPRLFQLCHSFRNEERSETHSPEFAMLEWYRAGETYEALMEDCVGLLRACAEAAGCRTFTWRGTESDPFADWRRLSVAESFETYAGIDLLACAPDAAKLGEAAARIGIPPHEGDAFDDIFFRIFAERIEPHLGVGAPCILYDYPVSMAALSRPKASDPRLAERFEIYVAGMELANAFGELTDAAEQRRRFEKDTALARRIYGRANPIDEDFLAALEHGMPESSGIALGFDRLVMLATGATRIESILFAPVAAAR
jgi:lysyl-tRNA synthetase class 2